MPVSSASQTRGREKALSSRRIAPAGNGGRRWYPVENRRHGDRRRHRDHDERGAPAEEPVRAASRLATATPPMSSSSIAFRGRRAPTTANSGAPTTTPERYSERKA